MIFNANLDKLLETEIVGNFVMKRGMNAKVCTQKKITSLLLCNSRYIIDIRDNVIENYLEFDFVDTFGWLMISGSRAVECSINFGFQGIGEARSGETSSDLGKYFLSCGPEKAEDLISNFEAIGHLLDFIDGLDGFRGIVASGFPSILSESIEALTPWSIERYQKCFAQERLASPERL